MSLWIEMRRSRGCQPLITPGFPRAVSGTRTQCPCWGSQEPQLEGGGEVLRV